MKNINPTSDASDEELSAKLDAHVRNDRFFSWLIVLALTLEAAIVWAYRHDKTEAFLFIVADLAIAIGVWGEIHSGRKEKVIADELSRRSNLKVAKANERALALELEAAEQREKSALAERALLELKNKVNDRHVGEDRFWPIVHALVDPVKGGIPKYSVSVFCLGETSEPCRFAAEIVAALRLFSVSVKFENPGTIPELLWAEPSDDPGVSIRARETTAILAWIKIMKGMGVLSCRGIEDSTLASDEIHLIITEPRQRRLTESEESYAIRNAATIQINTSPA